LRFTRLTTSDFVLNSRDRSLSNLGTKRLPWASAKREISPLDTPKEKRAACKSRENLCGVRKPVGVVSQNRVFRALQSDKPPALGLLPVCRELTYLTAFYDECYIGNDREPTRAGGLAPLASLFLILMLRGCAIHLEEEKCGG
jgi:hypothetical protein